MDLPYYQRYFKKKKRDRELLHSEEAGDDGQIARGVAHEVRNPLTNIQLSLHQLNNEIGTNDDEKMYTEIFSETQTG